GQTFLREARGFIVRVSGAEPCMSRLYELMNPLTEVCPLGKALTLQATLGYNHRRTMATDSPGILIVDDNEDNRYTLQLIFETDGHERIASAAGGLMNYGPSIAD